MSFDIDMIKAVYEELPAKVEQARRLLDRPLTLAEKILYAHLYNDLPKTPFERGKSYVEFKVDRVAMQDVTAQTALLQFMMAGKSRVQVPTTVH